MRSRWCAILAHAVPPWLASNGGPLAKKAMKQFMYALATLGLHQVVMKNRGPEQARIEESRELAKEATSQRKIFMKLTGMRRF